MTLKLYLKNAASRATFTLASLELRSLWQYHAPAPVQLSSFHEWPKGSTASGTTNSIVNINIININVKLALTRLCQCMLSLSMTLSMMSMTLTLRSTLEVLHVCASWITLPDVTSNGIVKASVHVNDGDGHSRHGHNRSMSTGVCHCQWFSAVAIATAVSKRSVAALQGQSGKKLACQIFSNYWQCQWQ